MNTWVVYSRSGCTLCEAFAADLVALLGSRAAAVQVVDVESDPRLSQRYSDRVPVLTIDGEFVCAYRLDVERVRRYLEQATR